MKDHHEGKSMEIFCGVLFVVSLAIAIGIALTMN